MLSHPQVTDTAVIAAPSEQWDEMPVVLVVLKSGTEESVEDIKLCGNTQLGKAQRISAIHLLEELP